MSIGQHVYRVRARPCSGAAHRCSDQRTFVAESLLFEESLFALLMMNVFLDDALFNALYFSDGSSRRVEDRVYL